MKNRCRGFLLYEALLGLGLLVLLASVMAMQTSEYARARRIAADQQAAVCLAEQAALDVHTGGAPPTEDEDRKVAVELYDAAAPPGFQWIAVRAEVRGQPAVLFTLQRLPGGMP